MRIIIKGKAYNINKENVEKKMRGLSILQRLEGNSFPLSKY